MMRFTLGLFMATLFLSSPAFAGFEWVPPTQVSQNNSASNADRGHADMGAPFPAASVTAEPLPEIPMNILPPEESMVQPVRQKPAMQPVPRAPKANTLSRQKLVINPYPLRETEVVSNPAGKNMTEVYKAMNEKAGKLHPVNLGSGMSTGGKQQEKYVPRATRLASASYKTFTGDGMTPMMGAEPAPLPGVIPQMKVDRAPLDNVYAEAVGFGRDLPLALALSQVIPEQYSPSFAQNVDAGVTVSWEGGKSWNQVLNDMLRPKNLTAVIQGNQVIIQPTAKL